MECPHIDRDIHPNLQYHERKNYISGDGTEYIYWEHDEGYGRRRLCQFCKIVGRKRDIFQCLNESEWKVCPHYRFRAEDADAPD